MKKIPIGAEAASILIGQVEFLDEPIMAFCPTRKCRHNRKLIRGRPAHTFHPIGSWTAERDAHCRVL